MKNNNTNNGVALEEFFLLETAMNQHLYRVAVASYNRAVHHHEELVDQLNKLDGEARDALLQQVEQAEKTVKAFECAVNEYTSANIPDRNKTQGYEALSGRLDYDISVLLAEPNHVSVKETPRIKSPVLDRAFVYDANATGWRS